MEAVRRIGAGQELAQADSIHAFRELVVGRCRLWGIGTSYATKFLYVAGFDRASADDRLPPLVLDRWVTTALFGSERRTSSAEAYRSYLEFARVASEGARPDLVEFALFNIGQSDG